MLKTNGTGDGSRTRTSLRTRDFKSRASTNSATPALYKDSISGRANHCSRVSSMVMDDTLYVLWFALGVVLIVAEIFTLGFVLLWFGVGSIAAAVVGLLGGGLVSQFITFAVVSIALTALSRTILYDYLPRDGHIIKTGVESLPGRIGTVTEASRGSMNEGAVKVFGTTWTAFPIDGDTQLTEGEKVEVVEVRGSSIYVRRSPRELPGWRDDDPS